jgi:hypothetical protein
MRPYYAEEFRDSGGATWSGTGNNWYPIPDVGFNQCYSDNSNCNQQPDFIELDFIGNSDMTVVLGPEAGQRRISGGNPVLTYHQVGACNGYPSEVGGGSSAGPGHAYVVFKVEAIDNSRVGSAFQFDPSKLYLIQNGQRVSIDPNLSFVRDILGPFAAVPETIQPYQLVGINGYCTLVVSTSSNPQDPEAEANETAYFLNYDGILTTKTNASRTSWPRTQNCRSISLA